MLISESMLSGFCSVLSVTLCHLWQTRCVINRKTLFITDKQCFSIEKHCFSLEKHSLSPKTQFEWKAEFLKNIVFTVDKHSSSMKNKVFRKTDFRSKNRVYRKTLLFDLINTVYRPINCFSIEKHSLWKNSVLNLINTVYRPINSVFQLKNIVFLQ